MAHFLEIDAHHPDYRSVGQIAGCLEKGGIAILPTDSIYAMVTLLGNQKGMERICAMNGTKPNKTKLSLLCSDLATISGFTMPISNSTFRILKHSLPGPFTFVLKANKKIPQLFHYNRKQIGVRIPNLELIHSVIERLGYPLISTSIHADDDILEYSPDPREIYDRYEDLVDMFVDGGPGGIEPTTVVDCSENQPVILRQGAGMLD